MKTKKQIGEDYIKERFGENRIKRNSRWYSEREIKEVINIYLNDEEQWKRLKIYLLNFIEDEKMKAEKCKSPYWLCEKCGYINQNKEAYCHRCNEKKEGKEIKEFFDWQEVNKIETKKPILKLVGQDGNAFAILGKARKVAKENDMDWETIQKEATSDDYDHLLQTMMKYFEVE